MVKAQENPAKTANTMGSGKRGPRIKNGTGKTSENTGGNALTFKKTGGAHETPKNAGNALTKSNQEIMSTVTARIMTKGMTARIMTKGMTAGMMTKGLGAGKCESPLNAF
jgi:hypothetical protein